MIGLEQWRCAIGLFMFKSMKAKPDSKNKNNNNNNFGRSYDDLSDLCGRLFIMSITFWLFHFSHQGIAFVLSSSNCFDFDLLLQSGDVESHPGPGSMEEMIERLGEKIMRDNEKNNEKIMSAINKVESNLESLKKSVDSLNQDVLTVKNRVKEIEGEQDVQRLDIIECGETMAKLDERILKLEEATEKQAQYSRRENVILHGVAEQQSNDYDSVRKHVTQILNNNVKVKTWQETDIQRAHRLGNDSAKKPRPIIVRLKQFHDKLHILKARDEFKKCAIKVANDLTPHQRSELSRLRDKNQKGYYKKGVLHIVENPSGISEKHT